MQVIECSGSPREMGRQYGEQVAESIRDNIAEGIEGARKAGPGKVGMRLPRMLRPGLRTFSRNSKVWRKAAHPPGNTAAAEPSQHLYPAGRSVHVHGTARL